MTIFILIVVLAYLVALIDGAAGLGRFLKRVERDARECFKNRKKC